MKCLMIDASNFQSSVKVLFLCHLKEFLDFLKALRSINILVKSTLEMEMLQSLKLIS